MTKEQMKQWLREVEFHCTTKHEYDESGNEWKTSIYKKDGKFYSVYFCNGAPCHHLKTGEYAPIQVEPVTVVIEKTQWEPVVE